MAGRKSPTAPKRKAVAKIEKRECIVCSEDLTMFDLFKSSITLQKRPMYTLKFDYADKRLEIHVYNCWRFSDQQLIRLTNIVAEHGLAIAQSGYASINLWDVDPVRIIN